MASNPTNTATTLSDLLREIAENAASAAPEDKLKMRVELLKFAVGGKSKRRGEWIN